MDFGAVSVADLAAARRQGRSLASLDAELRRLLAEQPDDEAAIRVAKRVTVLAEGAVGRAARRTSPAWITSSLPARPDTPWLAKLWDDAVAAAAVYLERWSSVRPTAEGGPWSSILGPAGSSDRQQDERDAASRLLTKATLAIVPRDLANHAPQRAPEAVTISLPELEARGTDDRPVDAAAEVAEARQRLEAAVTSEDQARAALARAEERVGRLSQSDRRGRRRDRRGLADARLVLDETAADLNAAAANRDLREHEYLDAASALNRAEVGRTPSAEIRAREATIRRTTLTKPPAWLTDHLKSLAESGRSGSQSRQLARLYGDVAIYRERYEIRTTKLDDRAANVEDLVGPRAAEPGPMQHDWDRIGPHLAASINGPSIRPSLISR